MSESKQTAQKTVTKVEEKEEKRRPLQNFIVPVGGSTEILLDINDAVKFAQELAKFIKDQKLTVKICNKDYVKVEGWQFAGLNFGITAVPRKPERIETSGEEIKYGCEVDLIRILNGDKIGFGYGLCSNREPSKKSFLEYAIASMAQTRGIAKAYRNMLAWLIKAAGFEPTPAEEMDEAMDAKAIEVVEEIEKETEEKKPAEKKTKEKETKEEKKDEAVIEEKEEKPKAPETDEEFELELEE